MYHRLKYNEDIFRKSIFAMKDQDYIRKNLGLSPHVNVPSDMLPARIFFVVAREIRRAIEGR